MSTPPRPASLPPADARDFRVAHFAVHQALYFALKLLDTPDSPLGADADEARIALRRAWVATHPPEDDSLYELPREPDVERAMLREWKKQNATSIAAASLPPAPPADAEIGKLVDVLETSIRDAPKNFILKRSPDFAGVDIIDHEATDRVREEWRAKTRAARTAIEKASAALTEELDATREQLEMAIDTCAHLRADALTPEEARALQGISRTGDGDYMPVLDSAKAKLRRIAEGK